MVFSKVLSVLPLLFITNAYALDGGERIKEIMAKVGKAFGVAAETAGVATADIIGATFSTASGITKGVGKTAESAVNLVAHTTTGLSNVSENLSDTAAGYTARNKITQNSDTKIHSSIKNARTITEQKRIENELEQKKNKV